MLDKRREHASGDIASRRKPGKRLVKLPGEKSHVERTESATYLARRVALDKLEKRARNGR